MAKLFRNSGVARLSGAVGLSFAKSILLGTDPKFVRFCRVLLDVGAWFAKPVADLVAEPFGSIEREVVSGGGVRYQSRIEAACQFPAAARVGQSVLH